MGSNIPSSCECSWRRIVETLPHLVLTATPDGAIDYVGPQMVAYAGVPGSGLLGRSWLEIIHPDDRAKSARDWDEAVRTGNHCHGEHRLRRSDGEYRWFSFDARAVHDEAGRIASWTRVCVDVTERRQAEAEAQQVKDRVQQALRGSYISILDIDLTPDNDMGDVQAYNAGWETRVPEARVPDRFHALLRKLVHPDDQERFLSAFTACVRGETPELHVEFRSIGYRATGDGDGEVHWRLGRGHVERDERGTPVRFLGTGQDITKIKHAEEETRRATEQLHLAMQLSRVQMWSFELDDGRLDTAQGTYINTPWGLGYEAGEMPQKFREQLASTVVPEDRDRATAAILDCIAGRTPQFEAEYRVLHKDGTFHWSLGRGHVIRDELGAPKRFIGAGLDITKIKHAEEEARRAAEHLQLITRLSGVSLWSYELVDGSVATAKPWVASAAQLLGYDLAEGPVEFGAKLATWVHPEEQASMRQALQDCIDGKTPQFDFECRLRNKDGSWRWILARGIVTRDAMDRPLTLSGTLVDIASLKQVQEELQRVKKRLELAVVGSNTCTWDFEMPDGQIANARPVCNNWAKLHGYEEEPSMEGIPNTFALSLAPEDRAPFHAEIQAFLDGTERQWEREMRAVHKDGSYRWHLTRGVATRAVDGRATRFTGMKIDITDRKLMERALQESEERVRRTFENAAVGMILTDLDGRFLEYNARFCEFLGYSREELAGRKLVELMVPDEVGVDLEDRRRLVRGEIQSFTRDKRYFRKDGAVVWGSITASIIQRHTDGTPAHVMGILQDITERKFLEEALEKAKTTFELCLRDSNVAVCEGQFPGGVFDLAEWSASNLWSAFNLWELMGHDGRALPSDLMKTAAAIVPAEDRDRVMQEFLEQLTAAPTWDLEHPILHKDGTVHWWLSRGSLTRDEAGRPLSFAATVVDITKLKHVEGELLRAREAAETANRAKDEFLANVSHEIRTPMNAILGMTELALDSAPSDHQRQLLGTVRSAAKSLLTIINDLLDFSKIAAGKLTLDGADFSLRGAVGDTLKALAVRAHRKGLELLCHVGRDVPDALHGDAGRLRQVLINLVGNAIKFTSRGEVEVDVATEAPLVH